MSLLGSDVPPPEHLGPVGGYLISDAFSWCRGEVIFSNGSEVSVVSPPRLLEAVRPWTSRRSRSLDVLGRAVLGPAEATQTTNGGGNPRLRTAFDETAPSATDAANAQRVVVVTDAPASGTAITKALTALGVECVKISEPKTDFTAAEQLAAVARGAGADRCGGRGGRR